LVRPLWRCHITAVCRGQPAQTRNTAVTGAQAGAGCTDYLQGVGFSLGCVNHAHILEIFTSTPYREERGVIQFSIGLVTRGPLLSVTRLARLPGVHLHWRAIHSRRLARPGEKDAYQIIHLSYYAVTLGAPHAPFCPFGFPLERGNVDVRSIDEGRFRVLIASLLLIFDCQETICQLSCLVTRQRKARPGRSIQLFRSACE